MGNQKDTADKAFLKKPEVFMEIMNYYLFHGKQVIKSVENLDASVIATLKKQGNVSQVSRLRDLLKKATIQKSEDAVYVLLGIENQSKVDYSMPVRCMLYDAIQYEQQCKDNNRRKDAKLLPVITLVIYYGAAAWTGPVSLFEMMDLDEQLKPFVADYRLNVLAVSEIPEKDIDQFKTELYQTMYFLKYQKDDEKLIKIPKNERYRLVSNEAVAFINSHANTEFKLNEEEGFVDMCEGMEKIRQRDLQAGRAEGREEYRVEITYANLHKYLEMLKNGSVSEELFIELAEMLPAEAEAWIRDYEEKQF